MTELITLILDEGGPDGTYVNKGYVTIASSLRFPDSSDAMIIGTKSKQVRFDRGVSPPQVTLYPCDLIGPQNDDDTPGWSYTISYSSDFPGQPRTWSFQLLSTNGTTQNLRDLASIPVALPGQSYVPWPNTPPTDGELFGWDGLKVVGVPQPSSGLVSRRPAWRPASWQQLFQTSHAWTAVGSGVGSSNLNDTSTFVKGTQCASITTAANGVQAAFKSPTFAAVDLTGMALRITLKVDDVTHLNDITFFLGTSSFSNYFLWTVHTASSPSTTQNYIQSGEWVTITIPWANVQTAVGTFSITAGVPSVKSGFTCMQMAVFDDAAGAVTVHLQSIEIIPDTVNTFPNGLVSVVFDDSYGDVWTYARPVMDTYGYRGTAYTIADAIGQGGSLTLAQLQALQNMSGWEIAGHAYTSAAHNTGYKNLTALQVADEMRSMRAWLISHGFTGDSFAYPSGFFCNTTDNVPIDQICAQYFSTGRSIISETYETFPPPMPYRVRSKTGISSSGTAVSTITASGGPLDRCQNDGSWYVITMHDVITGSPSASTQISQTDFTTLMAAINSRGIAVLPVGDVIRNYG